MAESSRRKIPTRRRTASRASQPSIAPRTASIEGWISDEERRSEFITLWKDKPLITPKFIQFQWFVNRCQHPISSGLLLLLLLLLLLYIYISFSFFLILLFFISSFYFILFYFIFHFFKKKKKKHI